jgi:peptide/nickel transport system permease protein
VVGLVILALILLAAAFADLLFPGDPLEMLDMPFIWPFTDRAYPLGTDSLGRDVVAGIVHGARASLLVGFLAAVASTAIGTLVGAVSGYFGGLLDKILAAITELFQTIPPFIFLVILLAIAPPKAIYVALAIGGVSWPAVARLVRAEFRSVRERDFVMAARSLGRSNRNIVLKEILPNVLPTIIVTASVMVASAILLESALAFLGLGDPDTVSWGSMIGEGRVQLSTAWYLTAAPGLAIVATVLALNLVGDALTDSLNPRLDER